MKIAWYSQVDSHLECLGDDGDWAKREDVEALLERNRLYREALLSVGGFDEWIEELEPEEDEDNG
jgi:hypothetical protein